MEGQRKLYVSNIPPNANSQWLESIFSNFGEVAEAHIMGNRRGRDGCLSAFVTMGSPQQAAAALEGLQCNPDRLTIKYAGPSGKGAGPAAQSPPPLAPTWARPGGHAPPPPSRPQPVLAGPPAPLHAAPPHYPPAPPRQDTGGVCKIYASNLPPTTDEYWLRESFGQFGTVVDIKILPAKGRESRLSAFVVLDHPVAAREAVAQLQNWEPDGVAKATVKLAAPKGVQGPPAPVPSYDVYSPPPMRPYIAQQPQHYAPAAPAHPPPQPRRSAPLEVGRPSKRPRLDADSIQGTEKTPIKLYVGNIEPHWDNSALEGLFLGYGEVIEASLIRREGRDGRRSGFVWIKGAPAAQAAVLGLHSMIPDGASAALTVRPADG